MSAKTQQKNYRFRAKVWKYKGPAGWYFVTLPMKLSQTIREAHGFSERGWGRLEAHASVKGCEWQTSIWFDSKFKCYLLPVKASVRKIAKISEGTLISVMLLLKEEERFKLLSHSR